MFLPSPCSFFFQDDSPTVGSEPVFDLSDVRPTTAASTPAKGKQTLTHCYEPDEALKIPKVVAALVQRPN